MPELPEVETVVRELRKRLKGRRIKQVKVRKPGILLAKPPLSRSSLINASITGVRRRGKYIILDLSRGLSLLVHLRMTGKLLFSKTTGTEAPQTVSYHKHDHCIFTLSGKSRLVFNDYRRFGRINLMRSGALDDYFSSRLGPEPLTMAASVFLASAAKRPKSRAKSFLLDQKNLAGVGNIYADEALYRSRIHPASRIATLDKKQLRLLHRNVVKILKEAIKGLGTTFSDYRRADGSAGDFQNKLRVYGQQGKPCQKCREKILYTKLGGRGTHYCPTCQPTPADPLS